MRIAACVNGDRRPGAHLALPISPDQLTADARAVVDAGADEIHIHPRDTRGAESLEPQVLTPLMKALRATIPSEWSAHRSQGHHDGAVTDNALP